MPTPRPATRLRALAAALVAATLVAACDDRFNPTLAGIARPPVEVPANAPFDLHAVNDSALPHTTRFASALYSKMSGTFELHADSTWLFSTVHMVSALDGTPIGSSPVNYVGTWSVADSTIHLAPSYGRITVKGDTLFWRGGPRNSWEDTLTYTLVRK